MSFKRFDQEDVVISADSISSPAWSNDVVTLNAFYTSSAQVAGDTGEYYYNIYQTGSSETNAAIQFSIAYGNKTGSGSAYINPNVPSNTASSIVYKQYRTLVNGTEEEDLSFGGTTKDSIYVLAIERARFKEKLLPGSMTLQIGNRTFTDNSNYVETQTFSDAGRVFQLVSGSAGVRNTTSDGSVGYSSADGSYGLLLPDVGVIILNGDALNTDVSAISTNKTANVTTSPNLTDLYDALGSFTLRSEETVSSNYVFVRARNSEFNYSTNPSNITGSGELRHDIMIDSPQAFFTTVGLYNDNNDLLAVAKLSRPLLKDFTKEALVRIKLDY